MKHYPQYGNESTCEVITACICPKCGARHHLYIHWTGRGVPRKYCHACRGVVERSTAEVEYGLGPALGHIRMRRESES